MTQELKIYYEKKALIKAFFQKFIYSQLYNLYIYIFNTHIFRINFIIRQGKSILIIISQSKIF